MAGVVRLLSLAWLPVAIALSEGAIATGTSCGRPATPIHEVQGAGQKTPLNGRKVTVEAVVVGNFQGREALGGFYLQEEDEDTDDDPRTSEGLFVAADTPEISPGRRVRVTGRAGERFGQTTLARVSAIEICGTAAATAAEVRLPVARKRDLECFEGMRVILPQTLVVTAHHELARYGAVSVSSRRLFAPTQVAEPGEAARRVAKANARDRLLIDDGSESRYPHPTLHPKPGGLRADNTLRTGDTITGAEGIMAFGFNRYRIHPLKPLAFQPRNSRPAAPAQPAGLRIASFNVLNFFNGNGRGGGFPTPRGAESASELERQRAKIVAALSALRADVIGLMELENDSYGEHSAIKDLVRSLNAETSQAYVFVNPGVTRIGDNVITVGLLYRPATVEPVGNPAILDTKVDSRFNDDKNRPSLAQTFRQKTNGEVFTVAVNHLKSKGSSCADIDDPNANDGQGNCNRTRTAAAKALVNWLAAHPTGQDDADVLIIGDLNSYAREDPIRALEAARYVNLIARFGGDKAYSYVRQGQAGYLDHALASPSLTAQVTGASDWHINADEPRALAYFEAFRNGDRRTLKSADQLQSLYRADPFRASDHDPIVVELKLGKSQRD